jgi:penicillin-binding protein 1A
VRRGGFGRFMRAFAIVTALLLVAVAVTGCAVYSSMSSQLPDPDLTKARGRDQSTVIVDRHGKTIVRLFAEENRQDVDLTKMPAHLRQAVIATEDRRFYEHEGVDPIGIGRALMTDIIKGEKAQGGSTITQQYVKQAFVTSEKTLKRKVQEAILAQKVEQRYSKDEILELYLNTIYFGHGAYGVEAASRAYFGTGVDKLTLAQSAVLAGVIKSPGRYSPYLDPIAAKKRRDTVLFQMRSQGYISEAEYSEAVATEIKLAGLKKSSVKAPYFVEWVKEQLVDRFGEKLVYRGGLRVKTTLDLASQKAAEKAVKDILNRKSDPSAAVVSLDPQTGETIALVGGRDFDAQQFNVAVQGQGRQPGSAFKPFVLATALSQGVSPEQGYKSGPIRIPVGDGTWSVTGAPGAGKGATMRLRRATEMSVNSVFAQLIMDVGPDKVVETAESLGIRKGISPVPAIALGGLERGVTPLEMASAYGSFAAGGKRATPFAIKEVKDHEGKVLFVHKPELVEAIDPAVAYLTTDILTGVIRRGTGVAAGIGRPAAGKTGTTQQYRDAWFVGYTPQLTTAVWVGYPASQKEMLNVHGRRVTGGSFPALIWSRYMRAALAGKPAERFTRPAGLKTVTLCSVSGGTPTEFCPEKIKALVLSAHVPDTCEVHTKPVEVKVPELVGLTKADALSKLETLGLKVKLVEQPVAGVGAGVVASQQPAAGTKLKTGAEVSIVVSTGENANLPPVAAFTAPTTGRTGKAIEVDASGSTDDGKIARYYWEFGDGATGSGVTATHTYTTPGTYEITLWITDDGGSQSSVTRQIVIK